MKHVLITGSEGFIGKNLREHLYERKDIKVLLFDKEQQISDLQELVAQSDIIFHLAGVNRPQDPLEFNTGNTGLTSQLLSMIESNISLSKRKIPIVFTSSTQASLENPYGTSKNRSEKIVFDYAKKSGSEVHVFRLPNVFGKWCRPNYNSVVATFCYNIVHDLPIQIHDPKAPLTLVYIDDVIQQFVRIIDGHACEHDTDGYARVLTTYTTTVGEIADQIISYKQSRENMITEPVGTGFFRALYSTYLSYLPKESFSYPVREHRDSRGVFVEMLKTKDSGQFSFFTAHPGITRGGHYHHSKTEKFLVLKGEAKFRFQHILTGEMHEIITKGDHPVIVDTVPGWIHDISNIGNDDLIVMLWANEMFDCDHPDTYSRPL